MPCPTCDKSADTLWPELLECTYNGIVCSVECAIRQHLDAQADHSCGGCGYLSDSTRIAFEKATDEVLMKKPIYSLGSADPRTFHSFSGADIKIYKLPIKTDIDTITEKPNDFKGTIAKGKDLFECQAFSFLEIEKKGTLVFACLSGNFIPLENNYHLLMVANDEFGNQATMALAGVRDTERGFGISIDDTVMEYSITISFDRVLIWRRTQQARFPKLASKEECLEKLQ